MKMQGLYDTKNNYTGKYKLAGYKRVLDLHAISLQDAITDSTINRLSDRSTHPGIGWFWDLPVQKHFHISMSSVNISSDIVSIAR